MDNFQMPSGHISETAAERERVKLPQGKREEDRLTLLRLRRLSRVVMCKNERHRFEARKLYRSNIVKYLEKCMASPSDKVRYLALQLFCSTIPRLGNKTDSLLKPLLPKIFQILQKSEGKEMKLLALHFLRGFFRHTKSLSSFVDSYIRLGIGNSDPEIQISCCLGLNIVFDQDIGNSLLSQLIVPIASLLTRRIFLLLRTAYRTLKHIHNIVGENRFFDLMRCAQPEALEIYKDLCYFEESDSFFKANINNCSTFVSEYQIKRRNANGKDFGIFDPILLDQIKGTRDCQTALFVCNFTTAFKMTLWKEEDFNPHIMDFLKLINSFISDPNRLIQLSGVKILKELINKMSFVLSPHIQWIIQMLRQGLGSPNTKLRSTVKKVLFKLMRNIHPMTVIWQLLHTKNASFKTTALVFIQDKLSCFSYYELDMVALCNYLGHSLEDKDSNLAKCSKDCIVLLLDIMNQCPAYGIRTEAIKVLLRNHKLRRETLKDIGVSGSSEEEDYQEEFESYSDDETTDFDSTSIPTGSTSTSISLALTHRSISTAGESEAVCNTTCSNLSLAIPRKIICGDSELNLVKNGPTNEESCKALKSDQHMELHSLGRFQTPRKWHENFYQARIGSLAESPDISSVKEGTTLFSETDSVSSRCFSRAFDNLRLGSSKPWTGYVTSPAPRADSSQACQDIEKCDHGSTSDFTAAKLSSSDAAVVCLDDRLAHNEIDFSDVFGSENIHVLKKLQPGDKPRKYCTPFSMQKDDGCSKVSEVRLLEENRAFGDADAFTKTNVNNLNTNLQEKWRMDSKFASEPYKQEGVEMDVLNKNKFNFNIMQVEDRGDNGCLVEPSYLESVTDEERESGIESDKIEESIMENDKYSTTKPMTKTFQECIDVESTSSKTLNCEAKSEHWNNDYKSQDKTYLRSIECNWCKKTQSDTEISVNGLTDDDEFNMNKPRIKALLIDKRVNNTDVDPYNISTDNLEENLPMDKFSDIDMLQEVKSSKKVSPNEFETIKMPFLPKSRQLPRTPIETKKKAFFGSEAKRERNKEYYDPNDKKKACEKKEACTIGSNNQCEDSERSFKKSIDKTTALNGAEAKTCNAGKHNSPSKWGGCQWKRDLEYAAKAAACPWAEMFEKKVKSMKPFSPQDAECEMKKAIDDLYGNEWQKKEAAMENVIRLAMHHSDLILEYSSKIVFSLSNEIKNFRQSVAGKAILTTGYLYEIMGKYFENNLRPIVAALLSKSGNRTLAAYFRLVIKSLFKIITSTSPQKSVMAFIHQGSKHSNKAARETAAQFIAILTERLGPENSLSASLSNPMLKCAAMFVTDSSALTRHCGKRMFKVFMKHPEFEKMKDHQLTVNTIQNIANILVQIKEKGVRNEILPISVID